MFEGARGGMGWVSADGRDGGGDGIVLWGCAVGEDAGGVGVVCDGFVDMTMQVGDTALVRD